MRHGRTPGRYLQALLISGIAVLWCTGATSAFAQPATFEPPIIRPLFGTAPTRIAVGDLNRDGIDDAVIFFSAKSPGLVVYLAHGDGTFARLFTECHDFNGAIPAIADVNGDGVPDLVSATDAGPAGEVDVCLSNGDGTFRPIVSSSIASRLSDVVAGDFNGDGMVDLADATQFVPGHGDGSFGAPVPLPVTGDVVASGDFNHDGHPDLVVGSKQNGTVTVLFQLGNGRFVVGGTYPAGGPVSGLATADMDRDGLVDVVVGNGSVSVLKGRSDGALDPPVTFDAQGTAGAIHIADFNGDGFPDIAAGYVQLNDGHGNLMPPLVMLLPGGGVSGVGRFNADAKPDLISFTGGESAEIGVLFNSTGDPTARQQVSWTDVVNATASFGTLSKNADAPDCGCFNAFGRSVQSIPAGLSLAEAGFTFTEFPGQTRAAGLASHAVSSLADIDFGFALQGQIQVIEQGVVKAQTDWAPYSDLRMSIDASGVHYYDNQTLLYSSASVPIYPLRVVGAMETEGAAISNTWVRMVLPGGSPTGGGEPITWTNEVNVTTSGSSIQKTSGCDGCFDASAVAAGSIDGPSGFMDFTVDDAFTGLEAGLTSSFASVAPDSIDFGLLLQGFGFVEVREDGVYRTDRRVQTGDVLRVSFDQGKVRYALNGETFYTSGVTPTLPLRAVVSLGGLDASISDVSVSGEPPGGPGGSIAWSELSNVVAGSTSLEKTDGCDGCFDARAVTSPVIQGDGFIEFTVVDPFAILVGGLTSVANPMAPEDVDFGWRPQGGGFVEVRENGAYKTDVAIHAGDVLRVAVSAGVVTYLVNGTATYTSTRVANLPLAAVVEIATADATVTDIGVGGGS